jgi:hypothetical protein
MQRVLLALTLIGLTCSISFRAQPALDPDAIGLWLFDEGAGDAAKDSSGNNNNGEITNGKWGDGKFEGALEFEGDGYVEILSSESLESPKDEITIMAWINPTDNNNKGIVYKGPFAGGDGDWDIHLSAGRTFQFRWNSGASRVVGTLVEIGSWTHVAATYDGKTCAIYFNGEADGEVQFDQPLASSDALLYLGSYWSTTYGFVGAIDEVFISRRAYTQNEINEAMNGLLDMLAIQPSDKVATTWAGVKARNR